MKQIISCSRRTDVPAFYYQWLQAQLKQHIVTVANPYNKKESIVDLSADAVHSIVLWSKDYSNILADPGYLKDYNLYFQFTINAYSPALEPSVINEGQALKQVYELSYKYSPEQINWRFDPVIISEMGEYRPSNPLAYARLDRFKYLCEQISACGVTRCTTSFLTPYGSVQKRLNRCNFYYVLPTPDEQHVILTEMAHIANCYGIQIYTCSSDFQGIPGIKRSSCIDGEVLTRLFGEKANKTKDAGQRKECGCHKSRDIADYTMKCQHGCLYCYANPI